MQDQFCASLNKVNIRLTVYVYIRKSSWNTDSDIQEPDRPQQDHPAACVIAQQYSSAAGFTLRFQSRKEKYGARFMNIITSCLHFKIAHLWNCVVWNCVSQGMFTSKNKHLYVEIKCQLDETVVFIADLIACSTCFGHHYAYHQELKSIIRWLLPVVFRAVVFKLLVWCGAEGFMSGLQDAAASCKPDT